RWEGSTRERGVDGKDAHAAELLGERHLAADGEAQGRDAEVHGELSYKREAEQREPSMTRRRSGQCEHSGGTEREGGVTGREQQSPDGRLAADGVKNTVEEEG